MSKKLRRIGMVAGFILAVGGSGAEAKTIYFGSGSESVPVAAGTTTILRFDEPVKTITNTADFVIKPASEEAPDYSMLAVEPRLSQGKAEVAFFLSGGSVARLSLSVVSGNAKVETIYDIKSQREFNEAKANALPHVDRLELMGAMIRGDQVSGYEVKAVNVVTSLAANHAAVVLEKIYDGGEYRGYVYRIKNKSPTADLDLDIRRLEFGRPNQAVLAFSDLDRLGKVGSPNDHSRLIVVTKPGSLYRDAVMPIRLKPAQTSGSQHGSSQSTNERSDHE